MIFNPTISFQQKLKMDGYLRKGYNNDTTLSEGDWVLNTGNNFFTRNINGNTSMICWYDGITFVSYDYNSTPYLRLYKINITNADLGTFTVSQLSTINLSSYIPNTNYSIQVMKKLDDNRMVAIIGTGRIVSSSRTKFLFFNCDGNSISSLSQTNEVNSGNYVIFNDLIESSSNTYICIGRYLESDRSILRAFSVSGNNLSLIGQYNDTVNNNQYSKIYSCNDSTYMVERTGLSSTNTFIQLFNFVGNNFSPIAQYTPNYEADIDGFGNNFVQINNNTYLLCGNEDSGSSCLNIAYELLQTDGSNITSISSGVIQNIQGKFWDMTISDNNAIALICNMLSNDNYNDYFWTVLQFSIENNIVNISNIIHNCYPLNVNRNTVVYEGTNLRYLPENNLVLWYDDSSSRRIEGLSITSTVVPITSTTEYTLLNDNYNVIGIISSINENGIADVYYPV